MSGPGQNQSSPYNQPRVLVGAGLAAVIVVGAIAVELVLHARSTRAVSVRVVKRVQHVPAPPGYTALTNPYLDPHFCVVLEEVGPNPVQVREVVRSAVANRSDEWAGRLFVDLPRLVAESVSRERAVELTAAIAAAGGKASAGDAIEYFVERVARDRATPIGRPSEVLDDAFLHAGRDTIADLRAVLADAGPAAVRREQARAAFVAFTTAEGRSLYQINCRPCHGTKGSGDGPMADGWSLRPVNFRVADTLAALKPGEVLWRIEEGAPGLFDEATPWDSSMPAWKHELDRELVWKIILGEFNTANVTARTDHEHSHSAHAPAKTAAIAPDTRRPPERSWLDWPVPAKPLAEKLREPEFATRGKYLYYYRCMPCHGVHGRGDGPAADTMWPRPRDFTDVPVAGFDDTMPPKFKFRTTRYGWLPTDDDLFRSISRGLVGTAMEGWAEVLEPDDIWQIIAHLKTFSKAWDDPEHIAKNPNDPVVVKEYTEPGAPGPITDFTAMQPPALSPQLLADGAETFRKIGCWQCHGVEARGDGSALGQHYDVWGYRAWPQNLAGELNFKAGHSIKEIYRNITSGIDGSVMPTVPTESLDPKDAKHGDDLRWALAAYVSSIVPPGGPNRTVTGTPNVVIARRVTGDLPSGPLDPRWDELAGTAVPLSGQLIVAPRWPAPSVNRVVVKAMYTDAPSGDDSVAIWLRWDDRRPNISHEDPPPDAMSSAESPLGPRTFLSPAGRPKSPVVFSCRDQLELQWPAEWTPGGRTPPLLFGDDDNPVVLWRWLADRQGLSLTKEVVRIENSQAERLVCSPADGAGGITNHAVDELRVAGPRSVPQPIGDTRRVRSAAHWSNGAWTVMMTRSLGSGVDQDIGFRERAAGPDVAAIRAPVPFAVHVWDGLAGELGTQMAVSSWAYLVFERPSPVWVHIASGAVALFVVIAIVALLVRRRVVA